MIKRFHTLYFVRNEPLRAKPSLAVLKSPQNNIQSLKKKKRKRNNRNKCMKIMTLCSYG